MVQIEIDNGSGFCFGVTTAIKKAEEELAAGKTLYCLGDIVHNGMECERLKQLGLVTINALTAADTVLIPIQCEFFALEGLSQLTNTVKQVKKVYNPKLDIEGVLITMFDGRLNLTMQVLAEVKKYFASKTFKSVIPRNVRISEAPSHGKPINYYDRGSKGAKAYSDLAD